MKQRLHFVCPAPSPYHSHLFREIAKDETIDLTVHFVYGRFSGHPWHSQDRRGFDSREYRTRFGIDWELVRLSCRETDAFFILPAWYDWTTRLVTLISRAPFAIWTDTPDTRAQRPPIKEWLRGLWVAGLFRRARFVIGTGRPAVAALRDMGAAEEKLVNLPFFVPCGDPALRPSVRLNASANALRLCSFGRLENRLKGFDIALDALAAARRSSGRENFHYTIAGAGEDEQLLRQQASDLGIAHLVTFAGWLEPDQVAALLRESHALLHPARYDPFPVAVLDALANGLAVFGSNASGSVIDRVQDGVSGYIHPVGDVDTLACQLAAALEDPGRLIAAGDRAWQTAAEWPASLGVAIIKSLAAATTSPG